jgi:acetyl-CoA carboxylase biotin carboxyl carrier protein
MSAASAKPAAQTRVAPADVDGIVGLIDRLEKLLNASELTEMEIEVGETSLVLRKPGAFAPAAASEAGVQSVAAAPAAVATQQSTAAPSPDPALNAVVAPLTGLFYASPSPGAEPYVKPGAQVLVGQVIGLIEAMKLFNEIKSDRAGRVVRVVPEDGALVKAKDPLVEVQP